MLDDGNMLKASICCLLCGHHMLNSCSHVLRHTQTQALHLEDYTEVDIMSSFENQLMLIAKLIARQQAGLGTVAVAFHLLARLDNF